MTQPLAGDDTPPHMEKSLRFVVEVDGVPHGMGGSFPLVPLGDYLGEWRKDP